MKIENPVRGISKASRPKVVHERRAWLEDESLVPKLMAALEKQQKPLALMFALGNRSGLRLGEIAGLRMSDLDHLSDGFITASHSYDGPLKEDRGTDAVQRTKTVPAPVGAGRRTAGSLRGDLAPYSGYENGPSDVHLSLVCVHGVQAVYLGASLSEMGRSSTAGPAQDCPRPRSHGSGLALVLLVVIPRPPRMSGAYRPWALAVVAALAAAALAAAACYQGSARRASVSDIDRQPGWVMVRGVPMIRQASEHDSGAAALAMVLGRWGMADASDQIRSAAAVTDTRGATARDLRAFARSRGLRSFLISGTNADLLHELADGRPVLVGLVQRYTGNRALSHYEVVIGVKPTTEHILLLDPARGPREDELGSFNREWQDAGRLALIVAPS